MKAWTQLDIAKSGGISPEARRVARVEGVNPANISRGIAAGRIAIPNNRLRRLKIPCGIGEGLKTKINANVGTSRDSSGVSEELKKIDACVALGADTVMDLSTGPDMKKILSKILAKSDVPVGTVPIYEAAVSCMYGCGSIEDMSVDSIFESISRQAALGVDFFTIHAGITMSALNMLKQSTRILDIVSRGGAFIARWMIANNRENPYYEYFDRVLEIAKSYDVAISLGDAMRPGSVADATDGPQVNELMVLGKLQKAALDYGVQTIIEGPGHVPMNEIEANVRLQKSLCNGAPFYVLGPLVTDIAPGYDHITSAIGGAIAAASGADFLCYVTPSEHLRLPTLEDVRIGVIASKIAAHAADIAKGLKGAIEKDKAMSAARSARDWKKQFALAIDKKRPSVYRERSSPNSEDVCTMCGEFCSIKMSEGCFKKS
jgi:phosphomethylpyrimidine synthase